MTIEDLLSRVLHLSKSQNTIDQIDALKKGNELLQLQLKEKNSVADILQQRVEELQQLVFFFFKFHFAKIIRLAWKYFVITMNK